MKKVVKNEDPCIHGDDPDECSFCFDVNTAKPKEVKSKEHFDIVKQKKEKNTQFEPIKLNRATNRLLDLITNALKDADWPDGVAPENWRQVSIDIIEKSIGRN